MSLKSGPKNRLVSSILCVRLFFDVEGAALLPDGPVMREKPIMLLLHGGPGGDHSGYKPSFSQLSELVQIVYLDHRGCGRSERGPVSSWTLAQWGDDDPVRAFGVIRDFLQS
jgi:pimeloyl-ACP methyl ester carboxylesterase